MTREELFSAVKLMAQRPRISDEELLLYMQLAESRMNTALREHPRNEVIAEHTQTADADTGAFSPLVPIPYNMAGLITLKQGDTLYPQYPAGGIEPSTGFIERGNCFQVFPAPGGETTYTITYHALVPTLEKGWSTNWIATWFSNAYVYGMLSELGSAVVHARRGEWGKAFASILHEITQQGWNQNFAATMKVRTYG